MQAIVLPPRCDRAAALAMLPELTAAIADGPIEIDGSRVEQVGQAMLQVLVSARRSADCALINASPALAKAGRTSGLMGELFDEAAA